MDRTVYCKDIHFHRATHGWAANVPLSLVHLRRNPATKAFLAEGVRAAGGVGLPVVLSSAVHDNCGDNTLVLQHKAVPAGQLVYA